MINIAKRICAFFRKWNIILSREQKRKSIVVFIAISISAFLEMLGVSIVLPYVAALLDVESFVRNESVARIAKLFGISSNWGIIVFMTLGVIVVYFLKDALLLLTDYLTLKYESNIQKDFSVMMLDSYLSRPYEDMLDINSAEALRGVTNDATGLYYIIQSFFTILSKLLVVLLIGVYLVITDPIMAIGICVLAGLACFFIVIRLKNRVRKSGTEFNEAIFETTKATNQAINGIKEISVMHRNDAFKNIHKMAAEKERKTLVIYRFLQSMPSRLIEFFFIAGLMLLLLIRLGSVNDISSFIPQLSAMAIAALRILPYVAAISGAVNQIIFYIPSFDNAYINFIKAREYENLCDLGNCTEEDKDSYIIFNKNIEVDDIVFCYRNSKKKVLDGLSLEIEKGEAVGIIGESGAGKSTLADVILGLLKPQSGNVRVDGYVGNNRSKQWGRFIGYIPQNVFLLDDTIKNNILFGQQSEENTDIKIWDVLEKVQLYELVQKLPNGLDTMVGERGVKFSGGQRQRIAIARALFNDPEVIIMDEATSALDTETEEAVMEAIEGLHGSKTLIIIAHRISTLKECDRIFCIKQGKAEEVTYAQICSNNGTSVVDT